MVYPPKFHLMFRNTVPPPLFRKYSYKKKKKKKSFGASLINLIKQIYIQTHLLKVENLTYAVALKEVSTREKPAILHNCVLLIRKEIDNERTTGNKIKKGNPGGHVTWEKIVLSFRSLSCLVWNS